ncbi:MAG: class I SAM-dependent methyltransferase [Thermoleophilaceae bacterium]
MNRRAVDRLVLAGDESVLEIGFGGGYALARILESTDGFVAGVEVSEAMLAQARHRFRRELGSGRMELKRGTASEIPYADERFDRVLAAQTIYFWPDLASGLREIHRVLKPGGRVVLATEGREAMEKRAVARHGFRIFGEEELQVLLEEAEFSAVDVERDTSTARRPAPHVFTIGRKSQPRAR